jgi:nanoRNase/pAp phosphatase (c-di-AMP/oligoRNAs hydrolase)
MSIQEIKRRLHSLSGVVKDEDKVLVLMHDNPDPDSLASAFGLQYLLSNLAEKPSLIGYSGIVGRAENRAMIKHLEIKLCPMSRIPIKEYSCIAMVDTQPSTGNNSLPAGLFPKIVFDHHPFRSASRRVAYREIKTKYNVTASIITEYLMATKFDFDSKLATALFYAIKSETEGLSREVGKIEARLRHYLYPYVDQKLLANIENARVSKEYYQTIHSALQNSTIYGDAVIARIENVQNPHIVAEVADFLMRLERIKWGFCFGTYNGDVLVSARTIERSNDAGNLMRQAFGNLGAAGGHEMMAGAKISLKAATAQGKRAFVRQLVVKVLELTGNDPKNGERLVE